jgi:hypothetical protein
MIWSRSSDMKSVVSPNTTGRAGSEWFPNLSACWCIHSSLGQGPLVIVLRKCLKSIPLFSWRLYFARRPHILPRLPGGVVVGGGVWDPWSARAAFALSHPTVPPTPRIPARIASRARVSPAAPAQDYYLKWRWQSEGDRLLAQNPAAQRWSVFSVLNAPFVSAGNPPMPSGVGSAIRPVRLGQHGDSAARVAKQIQPRWRGHERPFAAEGAADPRLGRGGFDLLPHVRILAHPSPAGNNRSHNRSPTTRKS